jgi:hypothetical protein
MFEWIISWIITPDFWGILFNSVGVLLVVSRFDKTPTLKLRKFELDDEQANPAVVIEGGLGIVGPLMGRFGKGAPATLVVSEEGVLFSAEGPWGRYSQPPLAYAQNCQCAELKPGWLLPNLFVAALVLELVGTTQPGWYMVVASGFSVAACCVALWAYERKVITMTFGDPDDEYAIRVAFRPQVVDGVLVDFARATRAAERINAVLAEARNADEYAKAAASRKASVALWASIRDGVQNQ